MATTECTYIGGQSGLLIRLPSGARVTAMRGVPFDALDSDAETLVARGDFHAAGMQGPKPVQSAGRARRRPPRQKVTIESGENLVPVAEASSVSGEVVESGDGEGGMPAEVVEKLEAAVTAEENEGGDCPICGKTLKTAKGLAKHQLGHESDKKKGA